jgi:hypothetical protein
VSANLIVDHRPSGDFLVVELGKNVSSTPVPSPVEALTVLERLRSESTKPFSMRPWGLQPSPKTRKRKLTRGSLFHGT